MSTGSPGTGHSSPTAAPPGAELPKAYRPAEHEARISAAWERAGAFHADPARVLRGEAEPFCVLIPPPNVTDRLHLGHALNNTLQDVLVRARRMMGFETLWMPGTDHAGIATQAVIERRLRKEGKLRGPLRSAMSRDEFVGIAQSFKDEYEAIITGQLRAMGCSCDWSRQRFTMDEVCARAVREAFFRLFRDGLIYRGKRLVNWDPVLQTAVADDECYDEEIDGQFYYLRYPLVHPLDAAPPRTGRAVGPDRASDRGRARGEEPDAVPVTWSELARRGFPGAEAHEAEEQAWVTVATTRPETYLGDTAVGVNPHDPRAAALRGLFVELPLVGRLIPIIEDGYVVMPAGRDNPYARAIGRHGAGDGAASSGQAEADEPGGAEPEAPDPKALLATGFLKVTPAHDPNDYELGQRHSLPLVNVFAPDATISDRHGWEDVGSARLFVGMPRDKAREKVAAEFKARGLLEGVRPYRHSVKHSDRSKAIIEPYLSDQWYVKVTDDRLRGAALRAMVAEQRSLAAPHRPGAAGDNALRFHPERYARTFESWHENIRDWCISRQLWWGHRIPVWWRKMPVYDVGGPLARDLERWEREGKICRAIPGEPRSAGPDDARANPTLDAVCIAPSAEAEEIRRALEEHGWEQDPDVLDTWFSSALWPMSTMGWPDPEQAARDTGVGDFPALLPAFNPSSTLCTAREIITLWVSRMVMFNRYLMPEGWVRGGASHRDGGGRSRFDADSMARGTGPVPFRDVYIHAVIQDGDGRKMSKSLGNGVDPLDIIASHGADAMRFTLCQMTTQTQDVRMPVVRDPATGRNTSPKFDGGRNFCNKLWNAARFALGILGAGGAGSAAGAPGHGARDRGGRGAFALPDRWMLSRLARGVEGIEAAIGRYEFSVYAQLAYDLLWRDFCDWYLEAIKPTVAADARQRDVLAHALGAIVRLLHPITPFITEAIWERLRAVRCGAIEGVELPPGRGGAGLMCSAGWPRVSAAWKDDAAEREFDRVRALVTAVREARAQQGVAPRRRVTLHAPAEVERVCRDARGLVEALAMVDRVTGEGPRAVSRSAPLAFEGRECRISWDAEAGGSDGVPVGAAAGDADTGAGGRGSEVSAARARLEKSLAEIDRSIRTLEGRLANPGYTEKAPAAMVQQTRDQLAKARAERETIAAMLERSA